MAGVDVGAANTGRGTAARRWTRLRERAAGFLPRGALVLSVLLLAGYIMGLVRDRAFAHMFGASGDLDAYNAAFVLPELILDVLVAGGLVAPFVPLFTGLRARDAEAAREFGRTILTYAILIMAIVSGLLFIFAPQTVALVAPGFGPAQRDLYTALFRVMCLTPVIFAASLVLGEVLVAERRFLAYGLAPLMYNGGIVAGTLLLGGRIGVFGAAIGALAGALGHLGIRFIGIRRTSFRPWPRWSLRTQGLGEFARLMLPKMLSYPIDPLTVLFFVALASSLEPGSVSSLAYARNFAGMPVSLFGAAFAIAAFPTLSLAFARGDRQIFVRTLTRNLVTITLTTLAAMAGLVLLGQLAIRILLGGGAFDEADITRTAGILVIFALAVPLESVSHLLSRGLYATHNTVLPTLASLTGFVATVLVAQSLIARIGLAAIPISYTIGMAIKVLLLTAALSGRIGQIGQPADIKARRPIRRLAPAFAGTLLVALAVGSLLSGQALSGVSLAVAPAETPWARLDPLPSSSAIAPGLFQTPGPADSPSAAPTGLAASLTPNSTPSASPAPSASGPFSMDLYQKGDYVGEFLDTWCVPAAMQTSMNIMDVGADVTKRTQTRIFALARSLDPAPDGGAEPEAWAQGLTSLGYGNYTVNAAVSIKAAIHLAAKQIRLTGRPAGLMVWRGAHSWVMSGFTASSDPALGDAFNVTSVRIEDVWYNRFSTIWGYSRPPDANVAVSDLSRDFLPWKRPLGSYPAKDGKFVIVIPTT